MRGSLHKPLWTLVWGGRSLVLCGLVLSLAVNTVAQNRVEVQSGGGYEKVYLDEPAFLAVGGSLHIRVLPNLLLGAEIRQMDGEDDRSALTVAPVVTWEFWAMPRVQPYVSGGLGWFRDREPLCFPDPGRTSCTRGIYESTSSRLSAAGGLKISLSDHFFVAAEARIIGAMVNLGIRF